MFLDTQQNNKCNKLTRKVWYRIVAFQVYQTDAFNNVSFAQMHYISREILLYYLPESYVIGAFNFLWPELNFRKYLTMRKTRAYCLRRGANRPFTNYLRSLRANGLFVDEKFRKNINIQNHWLPNLSKLFQEWYDNILECMYSLNASTCSDESLIHSFSSNLHKHMQS